MRTLYENVKSFVLQGNGNTEMITELSMFRAICNWNDMKVIIWDAGL